MWELLLVELAGCKMDQVRAATRLLLPNWSPHPPACEAALRRPGYLGVIPRDLLELIRLHFPDAWRDHAADSAARKVQLAAILPIDYARGTIPRASIQELFKDISKDIRCYVKLIGQYAVVHCGNTLVFLVLATGKEHKRVTIGYDCYATYAGMGTVGIVHIRRAPFAVSADCDALFNITGPAPEHIFPCGLILFSGNIVHPINRSSVALSRVGEINEYIRRCWECDHHGLYDCSPKFREIRLV